jgi:hypothetical protein
LVIAMILVGTKERVMPSKKEERFKPIQAIST